MKTAEPVAQAAPAVTAPVVETNPFFTAWTAPFGAAPFDKIKFEHFAPAFERGMAEQKAEALKIADQADAATFDNTIVPMEKSGELLTRVATVFFHLSSADTTDDIQKLEGDISPKLSRHQSEIYLNPKLFARVKAVYDARAQLNPEQRRLVERYMKNFVRAGAQLDDAGKARLSAIDERLSTLSTTFGQNMLNDTKAFTLTLEEKDLVGLPDFVRKDAAAAAEARGLKGKYVVAITRSSVEPFLQYSDRRDLREKAFKAWAARGDNGNQFDNNAIIAETLKLRLERAKLLGYATYADFALDDTMAKTPDAARKLMAKVWEPARLKFLKERDELQKQANADGAKIKIEAWDWRYYSEKVRKAKYDIDEAEVKPYLQLDKMLEGLFYTSNKLFGVTVVERKDIPVWNPDVRVFEVKDAAGKHIGLFYGDWFARDSKQSGAWMNSLRDQQKLNGIVTPIVINVCNFSKPAAGEPALLSFDDAETLFHEFGHALHGLLSNATYPTLSGTNVSRDFVEFPSQVMEHWVSTPEILSTYAVHYKTGEPMPKALLDKVQRAANFNQGFATVEYLSSALVDMDVHSQTNYDGFDARAFEKASLARIKMPKEVIMRHRMPHFSHIFAGGYSAGYYSYLWSEVLDADAFQAFVEAKNVFDPATAKKLKEEVYMRGNTRDLMTSYVAFRGKEPDTAPLLKNRGLN